VTFGAAREFDLGCARLFRNISGLEIGHLNPDAAAAYQRDYVCARFIASVTPSLGVSVFRWRQPETSHEQCKGACSCSKL
jgi:hypothetical protein